MEKELARFLKRSVQNKKDESEQLFEIASHSYQLLSYISDTKRISNKRIVKETNVIFDTLGSLCKKINLDDEEVAHIIYIELERVRKKLFDVSLFDLIFIFGNEFDEGSVNLFTKMGFLLAIVGRVYNKPLSSLFA